MIKAQLVINGFPVNIQFRRRDLKRMFLAAQMKSPTTLKLIRLLLLSKLRDLFIRKASNQQKLKMVPSNPDGSKKEGKQ